MISQLEAADAGAFDGLYVDLQTQAHMEAVALFRTYAGSGEDRVIVGFAKETLPVLVSHEQHVKALASGG
jgi:putative membrane protein